MIALRTAGRCALVFLIAGALSCAMLRPSNATPASPLPQWRQLHEQYVQRASRGSIDVLFLGDSITQQWSKSPLWTSQLAPLGAENFGVHGDGTRQVLWRVQNGELVGFSPKVVVLLVGVNDVLDGDSPEAVRDGTLAVIRELQARAPSAKILSFAIFPVGRTPRDERTRVAKTNDAVAAALPPEVRRVDIGDAFVAADGTIPEEVMPDGLHLGPRGYELWAARLTPMLREMLGRQ